MQYSFLNLLGTALIPELGSYITACSPGHIHLVLILVFTVGADPDQQVSVIFLKYPELSDKYSVSF